MPRLSPHPGGKRDDTVRQYVNTEKHRQGSGNEARQGQGDQAEEDGENATQRKQGPVPQAGESSRSCKSLLVAPQAPAQMKRRGTNGRALFWFVTRFPLLVGPLSDLSLQFFGRLARWTGFRGNIRHPLRSMDDADRCHHTCWSVFSKDSTCFSASSREMP